MTTEKPKKPRLKGFAMLIGRLIDSVKDTEECQYLIKGSKTRVLLNNLEGKWAALVTVKDGKITVQGIPNTPKKNLKRNKLRWWGFWEFPNLSYMQTAGDWKSGKWIRKMASGKVKGASQIAIVGQILALARPKEKEE